MAAYRRVYDSRHLQADCQEPGSATEPYAGGSRVWATFTFTFLTKCLVSWSSLLTMPRPLTYNRLQYAIHRRHPPAAGVHTDRLQGCSPKKWGTPETRLRQRFTVTQNINSAVLKLSYTAFQCVTSCNSGLTFARISVQKWGEWRTRPPCRKKWGWDAVPTRPCPTTPLIVSWTAG